MNRKALLIGLAFVFTLSLVFKSLVTMATAGRTERALQLENGQLAAKFFSSQILAEMPKLIPGSECDMSRSGGVRQNGREFDITKLHTFYFHREVSVEAQAIMKPMQQLVEELASMPEVLEWQSAEAKSDNIHRVCKFAVDDSTGRPKIQMLLHMSNLPNGLADSTRNGLDKYDWK